MKPRNVLLTTLLVALLLAWGMIRSKQQLRKEGIDRHPASLHFTATALCQLRCLQLEPADAQQVLAEGLVLYHRSNRRATPCPVWVIQGSSAKGITFQLRLEQCPGQMMVVQVRKPESSPGCNCVESTAPIAKNQLIEK